MTRSATRFFASGLAVAAPVLLALAGANAWLADRIMDPTESTYQRLLAPGQPLPNAVVGTSLARWGIDTRRLGRPEAPFYNLALDGSGPGYLAPFYRLLVRHQGVPERVVIGVGWTFLGRFGRDRGLEDDGEHLPGPDFLAAVATPGTDVGKLLVRRFPLLKHHGWLLHGVPAAMRGPDRWRDQEGFQEGPDKVFPVRKLAPLARDFGVEPAKAAVLAAFLAELRRDGVRTALVLTPTYAGVAGDRTRETAAFARLAAAHGALFLNYQDGPRAGAAGIAADPTSYWDMEHLTRSGSRRFTTVLDRDLRAAGFLAPASRPPAQAQPGLVPSVPR